MDATGFCYYDSLLLVVVWVVLGICAFYLGGVGRMAYGAFYTASETLAPPGVTVRVGAYLPEGRVLVC